MPSRRGFGASPRRHQRETASTVPVPGFVGIHKANRLADPRVVACRVGPGASWAIFWTASFRNSSYTRGRSYSAALGSPPSIWVRTCVTSLIVLPIPKLG